MQAEGQTNRQEERQTISSEKIYSRTHPSISDSNQGNVYITSVRQINRQTDREIDKIISYYRIAHF